MQRQPLPKFVDARKFVAGGMEIHASQQVADLSRFAAGLANTSGSVDVDLRFFRSEQGFKSVRLMFCVNAAWKQCLYALRLNLI